MADWRITIGTRYAHEPHPAFVDGRIDFEPHPDGYLTFVADTAAQARAAAFGLLGRSWAFLYGEPFEDTKWARLHPLGEQARIEVSPEIELEVS